MIYVALYLVIGFIVTSLIHRYFEETEPMEFLSILLIYPAVVVMIFLIMFSEIFKPYLDWIKK